MIITIIITPSTETRKNTPNSIDVDVKSIISDLQLFFGSHSGDGLVRVRPDIRPVGHRAGRNSEATPNRTA